MPAQTYYDLLGVPLNAKLDEIKSAYRRLAQELHPDKLPETLSPKLRDIAIQEFKQLREAYLVLSDTRARDTYDRVLAARYVEQYPQVSQPGGNPPPSGTFLPAAGQSSARKRVKWSWPLAVFSLASSAAIVAVVVAFGNGLAIFQQYPGERAAIAETSHTFEQLLAGPFVGDGAEVPVEETGETEIAEIAMGVGDDVELSEEEGSEERASEEIETSSEDGELQRERASGTVPSATAAEAESLEGEAAPYGSAAETVTVETIAPSAVAETGAAGGYSPGEIVRFASALLALQPVLEAAEERLEAATTVEERRSIETEFDVAAVQILLSYNIEPERYREMAIAAETDSELRLAVITATSRLQLLNR